MGCLLGEGLRYRTGRVLTKRCAEACSLTVRLTDRHANAVGSYSRRNMHRIVTKSSISDFLNRIRRVFLLPLQQERLNLYIALGSCVLAVLALYSAVRIFELQRRDALLFELERRYQEYEQLILSAESVGLTASHDIDSLHRISGRLRTILRAKGQATLDDLLTGRDAVLTDGSVALLSLKRHLVRLQPVGAPLVAPGDTSRNASAQMRNDAVNTGIRQAQ